MISRAQAYSASFFDYHSYKNFQRPWEAQVGREQVT
jgi:hypothetical protein